MYGFTVKDVYREVLRLAREEPDFVYTAQEEYEIGYGICYYVSADGQGNGRGCIVGQALGRLGVSQETLRGLDGFGNPSADFTIPTIIPATSGDEGMLEWIALVQGCQDKGMRWADSVKFAEEQVERLHGSD